jgi:hypothetical protein
VGIVAIGVPKKIEAGKRTKVSVKVKNFSNSTQTRNVQLLVNGAPAGPSQSITLRRYDNKVVKFEVRFNKGTATLTASLLPGDSNPANDTKTITVKVKDRDPGHNDHDDRDDRDDDDRHHDKDDDDRGRGGRD